MSGKLRIVLSETIAAILIVATVHSVSAQYPNTANANRARYQRSVAGVSGGSNARTVSGNASLSGVRVGLSGFMADMGRMPTSAEGLQALIKRPPGATNWRGPYISVTNAKQPFADPWGMQYRYTQTPAGSRFIYTIASNGPDRMPGTRDDLQIQF